VAESRRTVTIVFADVSSSTALGEALDPEALRGVLARYFEVLRTALEHHDGVVEKYIGDAVMAVFGLPAIHEDDALRAVRAAAEARERLDRLNDEIEAELGVVLAARIGVNTGEVVAGEADERQQLVTGDAVNVAARLEQAAKPGEILLGVGTLRLVRDAVRVDELDPLELKGKAERVAAFRLVEVLPGVPAFTRRLDAPFVGRQPELAELCAAFDRCAQDQACERVTVLGEPGIGKSRLVRELLNSVAERSRVLVGRCLSYGEGITYWPLAEIVEQIAGADVPAGLAKVMSGEADGELVANAISGAIGGSEDASSTEDTHWAVRRLLETLARERPVVVIVDDLHWAEPTMLDLVEYVTAFAEGVPILLVCVARPEVVDTRPALGMPGPRATVIRLAPLPAVEAEHLVTALVGEVTVSAARRATILDRAEGNPLFVEQMLAMDADARDEIEVPPTIQALLAARIDRLEPGERLVIERGAVEGRLFHRRAVLELAPGELRPAVAGHLLALVRKQLVRPDRTLFPGDDGFRFAHILVRDAAYAATSKELRAGLHERYAAWLERVSSPGYGEINEIVAYHLEQAARFSAELGRPDRALSARAGSRLGEAGVRALERGDIPAAMNLLKRARDLLHEDTHQRVRLGLRLSDAYIESGRFAEEEVLIEELTRDAEEVGDAVLSVAVGVERMFAMLQVPKVSAAEALAVGRAALPILEESGNDVALCRAWGLITRAHLTVAEYGSMEAAAERAFEAAKRSGDLRIEEETVFWLSGAELFGPMPIDEALAKCERVLPDPRERLTIAHKLHWRGGLNAFAGRPDGVREIAEARAIYRDLGLTMRWGGTAIADGIGSLVVGEPERAERVLREAVDVLEDLGEKGYLSTIAYYLAQALHEQGRFDESEELTRVSEVTTAPDDVASLVGWRYTRALALSARGVFDEAEALARESIELASSSDSLMQMADVHLALATVLERMGRSNIAAQEAKRAADLYARKGMETSAARAERLVPSLARPAANQAQRRHGDSA
jgi:class 3 adenylate cyclase/tetratricopeptide (TPR) repeat protein